jgi:ABC-2 type transport system ATP-binding protein
MIELRDFTKRYGNLVAVDSLNLKIAAGETFGFIGPNGAGKSTTIRFLATLLGATHGEGIINGYSVTRQPLLVRRSIGYMPDTFGVYERMKVWKFLDFFALGYGIRGRQRRQVVDAAVDRLGLGVKRNAHVSGLSRGMKQRLCLAKTLLHDPPVLILDEPANGLDPLARAELKTLLAELRKAGKTILISSHILSELGDSCTTVGMIERGKLLLAGPIDEVVRRIRGHRLIEIKFLDNFDAGLRMLGSDPHIANLRVDGNAVAFEFAGDDRQAAEILERLVATGAKMHFFGDREPTLQDVFMRVTKGAVG